MGRINPADYDKYDKPSKHNWLKLMDNGDVARVQFLYSSLDDVETYACHKVKLTSQDGKEYTKYVDCKRNYDDPVDDCPLCRAGLDVTPVTIISMYDHSDGSVKIWERGKTFIKKLENLFNRYPNLSNMVFEIERNGAKGDKKTSYEIYPMPDVEPVDVSEVEDPEILGSVILDKTVEDMEVYLETGSFPYDEDEEAESAPAQQTTSRRGSAPTTRTSRGGAVRRPSAK